MGLQLSGVERGRHENIVTASGLPLCREEDDPNDVVATRNLWSSENAPGDAWIIYLRSTSFRKYFTRVD